MSRDMKPRKSRSSGNRKKSGGGTLIGLFLGLVIGVVAAAGHGAVVVAGDAHAVGAQAAAAAAIDEDAELALGGLGALGGGLQLRRADLSPGWQ